MIERIMYLDENRALRSERDMWRELAQIAIEIARAK